MAPRASAQCSHRCFGAGKAARRQVYLRVAPRMVGVGWRGGWYGGGTAAHVWRATSVDLPAPDLSRGARRLRNNWRNLERRRQPNGSRRHAHGDRARRQSYHRVISSHFGAYDSIWAIARAIDGLCWLWRWQFLRRERADGRAALEDSGFR